jgi:hypothetical protein
MTLTTIDSQTKTAAFVGSSVSIATITGAWTIKLNISNLQTSDGSVPNARFEFDDNVGGLGTASLAGPTYSILGALGPSFDKVKSWKQQDFPSMRFGVSTAGISLQLSQISANTTCTYHAWLEY